MNYNKYYRAIALYFFARDYHTGQNSRGYKLLCMSQKAIKRYDTSEFKLSSNAVFKYGNIDKSNAYIRENYFNLLDKYENKF